MRGLTEPTMPPGAGEPPEPGYYGPVPGLPQARPPKRWTVWQAVLMVGGVLLAQLLAGLVVAAPVGALGLMESEWADTWFMPLLMIVSMVASLALLLWQRRRVGAKPLFDRAELRDRTGWLLACGVLVLSYGITVGRTLWESNPEIPTLNQDVLTLMDRPGAVPWVPLAIMGLCIVVLAPLTEEWLFRGILQEVLGTRWSFWLAVPVTSLIFGLLHGAQWWVAGLYGVGLGLLARRQKSLTLPIAAHAMINLSVFVLLVYSGLETR